MFGFEDTKRYKNKNGWEICQEICRAAVSIQGKRASLLGIPLEAPRLPEGRASDQGWGNQTMSGDEHKETVDGAEQDGTCR